jgi:hypothetical protein
LFIFLYCLNLGLFVNINALKKQNITSYKYITVKFGRGFISYKIVGLGGSIYGRARAALRRTGKLGVPKPDAASQPGAA